MLKLDDQLCFALYAATNAITRAYRPTLTELSLTYPQYLVMLVLWQNGATSVREIAERLQLGSSAITPLVDHLEQDGFVTRMRSTTDRRVVTVLLTPAGEELRHGAEAAQEDVVCRTGLTDDDIAALRERLHALTAELQQRAQALTAAAAE